jgi:hypothetical protein
MKNLKNIALAIIISAIILGTFYYQSNKKINIVRVVGYASKECESDVMKWIFSLNTTQPTQLKGFETLYNDINNIKFFLRQLGLEDLVLDIEPSYNYAHYHRDGYITGYNFDQQASVTLRDVSIFDDIEKLSLDLTEISKYVKYIRNSRVEYYISALPELKIEIIAEATKDARERALQVAKTTGAKLGKLINGRVGVFQITEPLSVEVQSYGIYSIQTRKKQISVTLTGEFQLK